MIVGDYYIKFETLEGKLYRIREFGDLITDYSPAGQYQGAFHFVTVNGGEFLDSGFRRISGPLRITQPTSLYLRYRNSSGAGPATATLTSTRENDAVVQSGVSLTLSRVATTQEYISSFTAVPEGYTGSVSGPSIQVAVGKGFLKAVQATAAPLGMVVQASKQSVTGGLLALTKTRVPIPATVQEIGFKGDHQITLWDDNLPEAEHIRVDEPDGTKTTWKRVGNPDYPVAYTVRAKPTLFATFSISPPLPVAVWVSVRVKRGSEVIASKRGVVLPAGGTAEIHDIPVEVEMETATRKTLPTLTWEMCLDDSDWVPVGDSGPHIMYWTYRNPPVPSFHGTGGTPFLPLYDLALKEAFEALPQGAGDPAPDEAEIRRLINRRVDARIRYNPGVGFGDQHPLQVYKFGEIQCGEGAALLRGLMRSVGVDGDLRYIWSGTDEARHLYRFRHPLGEVWVNFRISEPFRDTDPKTNANPHFTFHAVVSAGGWLYDPSYGKEYQALQFVESVFINQLASTLTVNSGNESQVFALTTLQENAFGTDPPWVCPHTQ